MGLSARRAKPEYTAERCFEAHQHALETHDFELRVAAQHALVALGSDAIDVLLRMLASANAETREDAAGALAALGRDERVTAGLIAALHDERDVQTIDTIVMALGRLRNRDAVPVLAALIRDPAADEQNRLEAVTSLGMIVHSRFDKRDDPLASALAWLDAN